MDLDDLLFDRICSILLDIIKEKQVDVGTYIFNTSSYKDYLVESSHLKKEFVLTVDEYDALSYYFKLIK